MAVACLVGFGAVTAALAAGLVEPDLAVREWAEAHRPPAADRTARVLNRLGQGAALMGIAGVLAAWLGAARWRRRAGWWPVVRPVAYLAVAVALMVPAVLALKYPLTARGAPSSALPPEETVRLFGPLPPGEYAAGYPAGHLVNAVVWYGVILALATALARSYGRAEPGRAVRLAFRVVPPAVLLVTTTYLSFHWLTDGLAGLALGVAIDRLLHLWRGWP